MPDGAIDHLEPRLDGASADVANLGVLARPLHMVVRAEGEVDLVDRFDRLLRLLGSDELGQVAADLMGKGELAIGKRSGAGEAGRDVAGLASDAPPGSILRAVPALDGSTLLDHDDMGVRTALKKLESREDPRRPRADDDDISFHGGRSPPTSWERESLPSENAPAPEKPVVMLQGWHPTHRPVRSFGQCLRSTGRPFSIMTTWVSGRPSRS